MVITVVVLSGGGRRRRIRARGVGIVVVKIVTGVIGLRTIIPSIAMSTLRSRGSIRRWVILSTLNIIVNDIVINDVDMSRNSI
jgi:hypothetical protein